MTADDIARRRLVGQHLATPTLEHAADVVGLLGAVQAQDYAGAKWALGLRARGVSDADVERAMSEGEIIRTHVLRPTWHFVAPIDLRWMLALTAPRVKAAMASYDRKLGLDEGVYRRSNRAIVRALRGGKQLTRAELAGAIRRAGVDVTGTQRLAHLMLRAELDAVVCSGARRGKQFTYALVEERVRPVPAIRRDDALLELATRYFATRGPATARDFAWWSGLTVADATKGVRMLEANLDREVIDGETYWFNRSARPRRSRAPRAHLLPNYDEYFIGFKDRSAIATRLKAADLVRGGSALISNVVVVDGQLVGGWRRRATERRGAVEVSLLTRLSEPEERAVAAAVSAYGEFLGLPMELRQRARSVRSTA